jgi:L-lactate dehydrogenase complex protein LldF
VCPVYERTGGHAYGSVYPGPIGVIITLQLLGPGQADTPPFASTLCGACREVCPVKIAIQRILVHLSARAVETKGMTGEQLMMRVLARVLRTGRTLERTQRILFSCRSVVNAMTSSRLFRRIPEPTKEWLASREAPLLPTTSARLARRRNEQ